MLPEKPVNVSIIGTAQEWTEIEQEKILLAKILFWFYSQEEDLSESFTFNHLKVFWSLFSFLLFFSS